MYIYTYIICTCSAPPSALAPFCSQGCRLLCCLATLSLGKLVPLLGKLVPVLPGPLSGRRNGKHHSVVKGVAWVIDTSPHNSA